MGSIMTRSLFYFLSFWLSVGIAEQDEEKGMQSCGINSEAAQLAQLMMNHPKQLRPFLACNQLLSNIAQDRAKQLGKNIADARITPNQVLIKGGFRIPHYYPISGNQVEAVAQKMDSPQQVIEYLAASTQHSDIVLGQGEFFGLQSQLGVGFYQAKDVTEHDQWVVLAAQPWEPQKVVFKKPKPEMPFKTAEGCDKDWKNGNDEFLKSKCRGLGKAKSKRKTKLD